MQTSQKQLDSNNVLESYLVERNLKSISKTIDLAIWITLCIMILLFVTMLADAYQNDLVDRSYDLPFAINFIIGFGLVAKGFPKLKSKKTTIKNSKPEHNTKSIESITKTNAPQFSN